MTGTSFIWTARPSMVPAITSRRDQHPKDNPKKHAEQEHRKCYREKSRAKNRRRNIFQNPCNDECMEGWLIVPNLGIEVMALKTKRCFGNFKPFVRTDLNGSPQGNE